MEYRVMKESRDMADHRGSAKKVDYFQIVEVLHKENGKITHWRKTRLSMKGCLGLEGLVRDVMNAFRMPVVIREIGSDSIERLIEIGG